MPEIRRWFLRVILSLLLIFHPILRVTYRGTDIFLIKFTGKPWKSKKRFLSGHKWEGVNTKVTQNFRSLVINKLAAQQYLYNIHTLTILFSTILGRACDEGAGAGKRKTDASRPAHTRMKTAAWWLGANLPCPWWERGEAAGDQGLRPCSCFSCFVCVCENVFFLLACLRYPYCRAEEQRAPYPQVTLCTRFKATLGTIVPPPCTADTSSYTEGVSAVIGMGWEVTLGLQFQVQTYHFFFASIVH